MSKKHVISHELTSNLSCDKCKSKEIKRLNEYKSQALSEAKWVWRHLLLFIKSEGADCTPYVPRSVDEYFDHQRYCVLEDCVIGEAHFLAMHKLMLLSAIHKWKQQINIQITCADCLVNYL